MWYKETEREKEDRYIKIYIHIGMHMQSGYSKNKRKRNRNKIEKLKKHVGKNGFCPKNIDICTQVLNIQ